jgi:NAD(P)-dependent dehydrogenase (short-subunit alcohol dehydrogenase family)
MDFTPECRDFLQFYRAKYERLDILINNAAQTVRRPAGFYTHLMANEERPISTKAQDLLLDHAACLQELKVLTTGASSNQNMPVTWHGPEPGIGLRASAKLSQIPYSFDNTLVANEVFPEGELDADLQQVDLRKTNSWRLRLGQIETTEMIEVQLVNSVAPFVQTAFRNNEERHTGKHIINVSAMEGKFHRFF